LALDPTHINTTMQLAADCSNLTAKFFEQ